MTALPRKLPTLQPRHLRIVIQASFFFAFFALFFALAVSRVSGEVASILLALDPLTAVGTALADWTIARWTWIGLAVLALTALLGRFFCGWICPLGTLQQLVSWLAGPQKRKATERNRYRRWFSAKYLILLVLLIWAALGSNHFGWLDPLALLHRAFATGVRPLWRGGAVPGGWVAFSMLALILLASAWMPRFFCRALCPAGALMGLFARLAPFRIHRSEPTCTDCNLCLIACQGADEPLGHHRVSECHVCLNCTQACSQHSLSYGIPPPETTESSMPLDIGRRRFLLTTVAATAVAPVIRVSGSGFAARAHDAIRPPGARAEEAFLARCITCGACGASCPTGVIISDLGRTGVEGLFTPVLDMRRGWCEPSCIRCMEVCPTAALELVEPAAKQAIGGPAEVTIGTAFIDRGRCLPWGMDTPCIVCEEMCPTSPKAIRLEEGRIVIRDGVEETLQLPYLDPELCTGCGLCENRCPVGEKAAIRVSSVGESRDPRNRLIQPSGVDLSYGEPPVTPPR
jgi:polyferredoxin/Pyruvate/2-oxoacid:ferredoxin oxidoreductase delta subunit